MDSSSRPSADPLKVDVQDFFPTQFQQPRAAPNVYAGAPRRHDPFANASDAALTPHHQHHHRPPAQQVISPTWVFPAHQPFQYVTFAPPQAQGAAPMQVLTFQQQQPPVAQRIGEQQQQPAQAPLMAVGRSPATPVAALQHFQQQQPQPLQSQTPPPSRPQQQQQQQVPQTTTKPPQQPQQPQPPQQQQQQQSPSVGRRVGDNNGSRAVFVAGLDYAVNDAQLAELFAPFGEIVSTRVLRKPETNDSRGFGYVNFAAAASAVQAAKAMDGEMRGSNVTGGLSVRVADHDSSYRAEPTKKLFLRNLPPTVTREQLAAHCASVMAPSSTDGSSNTAANTADAASVVVECHLHRDTSARGVKEGTSNLMGYVAFHTVQEAATALGRLHGTTPFGGSRPLEVKLAETLANRNERRRRTAGGATGTNGGSHARTA